MFKYYKSGDLSRYLYKIKGKTLPYEEVLDFMQQILSGLDYIHKKHFVHRDIKPANIIVGDCD